MHQDSDGDFGAAGAPTDDSGGAAAAASSSPSPDAGTGGDGSLPDESAGAPGAAGAPDDGLSGRWTGLTSQGRAFHFEVFAGAVINVGVDYEVDVPLADKVCVARGELATQLGKPVTLGSGGHFELGPLSGPPATYSVKGSVNRGMATGSVSISYPQPDCYGGAELTWTAERQVCGDGHLTWPETCDPADPLRSKNCTEVCQLSPVSEREPNDAPSAAASPIQDDAVISGSLGDADVDVFAIRNRLAGPVAVELEAHTETVGTCHVNDELADTLLEILDAKGAVLAQDDDGSRNWFCSHLARQILAGQTLYVRLSSAKGPIPSYNLHVKFQKS